MEIILRQAIEKLGSAGEVVEVRPGYARNYLLPQKLAYPATPGNIKVMEMERGKLLRKEALQREEAEKLRDMIQAVEITFLRKVGEHETLYGSVTNGDIAEELSKKGITVDKRKIGLEDHIKQIGSFDIPIRLFPEVIAQVKLHVEPEDAPDSGDSATEPESAPQETSE